MNEVNLYAARHTDAAHIKEFFTKKLLRATEEPIAFFDGIFYEAKNERVGGLSFHDYLIFSNKSVYLWARGISKDYLDRFNLGAVSIDAREKDQDFATLNFTISRVGKDPIYLIFDFVPLSEVKTLMLLHFTLESEIEATLGKSFLGEIPDDLAAKLLEQAKTVVEMKPFVLVEPEPEPNPAPFPAMMSNFTRIYGDSLLERMKQMRASAQEGTAASQGGYGYSGAAHDMRGYSAEFLRNQPRYPFSTGNFDAISMRRAEAIVRDMLNAIPEEYREQAKKDLTTMPERFSNAVLAVNELLQNIAKSKETQNFVIQVVETAVKNDGILGALFKGLQTIVSTPAAAKPAAPSSAPAETAAKDASASAPKPDEEPADAKASTEEKGGLFNAADSSKASFSDAAMHKERKKIRIKV